MRLIVGLGNPGEKYINTRHNVGFLVLDRYISDLGLKWELDKKSNAFVAKASDFYFMKPQTFMNKSGESVSKFASYYEISPQDVLVVHDDVDLEPGVVKMQLGKSSAGHRGVQSIIDALGTNEFWRVRVGIGKDPEGKIETDDWVLMNFKQEELEFINNINLIDYL